MGTRTGLGVPYEKNLLLMPGPAPSPPSTNYYTLSRLRTAYAVMAVDVVRR